MSSKVWAILLVIIASLSFLGWIGKSPKSKGVITIRFVGNIVPLFLDDKDVLEQLTGQREKFKSGLLLSEELDALESLLVAHPFIDDTEIYRDLLGNYEIEIKPATPIARIRNEKKKDYYIDDKGKILPWSNKHTARVLLVYPYSHSKVDSLLVDYINHIKKDPFWSKMIAEIHEVKNNQYVVIPQIGKQVLEIGSLEDYENKLSKLKVFYDEVLPAKGWNHYKRVNVAYQKQLICE